MKRILSRVLPHLTIILGVMTLVFYVVDGFNAVMAFMASDLSKQVFMVLAVCAIISSIMLISRQWKEDDRKAKKAAKRLETAEDEAAEAMFELEELKKSRETGKEEYANKHVWTACGTTLSARRNPTCFIWRKLRR